ncbi:hypothetical protein HL668_26870 [Bradyrhizobium sp. 81013]|nr:hypothetical protein [Bradyrhizobium aeschynomenes]NPV24512.1 hypothetical protein [Bradyrhizobium aeschynomenes]
MQPTWDPPLRYVEGSTPVPTLLLLWISCAILYAAYSSFRLSAGLTTFQDAIETLRLQPGALLAPILYAPAVFVVALTPWARRKRSAFQAVLLSNAILLGAPAIFFLTIWACAKL